MTEHLYKVGDKVKIKSLEWYKSMPKNNRGQITVDKNLPVFAPEMCHYCEKEGTIIEVIENDEYTSYKMNIGRDWYWVPFMFDDIKILRKKKLEKLEKI